MRASAQFLTLFRLFSLPVKHLYGLSLNQFMDILDFTGFTIVDDTLSVITGLVIVLLLFAIYWRADVRRLIMDKIRRLLAHINFSFRVKRVSKQEEHETLEALEKAEEEMKKE